MFLVVTSNHNLKGPEFESPFPQLRKKNRTRKQGNHILGKWTENEREETDLTGGNRKRIQERSILVGEWEWEWGSEDFKEDEERVKAESSRSMKLESQEE
ncbi:hypothetical protein TorRG33x02_038960 [Trema orientale]|uniref:Uncharacterized protein n=1 Tax=Trema orientale TaxID=63057 RepID=A0A2P5FQN0_TREOI|nr:hypothetical protein TorRG33x02_038960 [Trema orientale]